MQTEQLRQRRPIAEDDPELGNVQAGAVDGGAPSFEGRDNANQITLKDGIPRDHQPVPVPAHRRRVLRAVLDGDFDISVFGHEYTHPICNRMVGGPDDGLTGNQAGAMGESWCDLDALEYLHEFGYVAAGGSQRRGRRARTSPATSSVGIRNYALNANPLNYSDIGYDITGPEVHADGEIWNAVNYDIRAGAGREVQRERTRRVEQGAADWAAPRASCRPTCPGNRRWIQLVYDAWLLHAARRQHARRARRLPRRRHDALRRRQPGDAVDRVREARHGQGGIDQRHGRRQPDPGLRRARPARTPARSRSWSTPSRSPDVRR